MVAALCAHSIDQHLQSMGFVVDTTEEAVMTAAALSRHPSPASYTQDSSSAQSSPSAPTVHKAASPASAPTAAGSKAQGGAGSSRRSSSSSLPAIPANLPPRLRHLYAVYSEYRKSQQAAITQREQSRLQGHDPNNSPRPTPQATVGTVEESSFAAERGTTTASAPLSRPLAIAVARKINGAEAASTAAVGAHAAADAAATITTTTNTDQLRAPVTAVVPSAPQPQGPCLSFAAYCLRYLYQPLLSSNDLLSYDLRLGFAHVPLVVLHRPYGLLLIDLYTASASYLQQHLEELLQRRHNLLHLKQQLLDASARALHWTDAQKQAAQRSTVILLSLVSCTHEQIKQLLHVVCAPHHLHSKERRELLELFTGRLPEVQIRYVAASNRARLQEHLQALYQQPQTDFFAHGQSTAPLWLTPAQVLSHEAAANVASATASVGAGAVNATTAAIAHTAGTASSLSSWPASFFSGALALTSAPEGASPHTPDKHLFACIAWPQPLGFTGSQWQQWARFMRQASFTFQPTSAQQVFTPQYTQLEITARQKPQHTEVELPAAKDRSSTPEPLPLVERIATESVADSGELSFLQLDGFQVEAILSPEPVLLINGVFGAGRSAVLLEKAVYTYIRLTKQQAALTIKGRACTAEGAAITAPLPATITPATPASPAATNAGSGAGADSAAAGTDRVRVLLLHHHAARGQWYQLGLQQHFAAVPTADFAVWAGEAYLPVLQQQKHAQALSQISAPLPQSSIPRAALPRCAVLIIDDAQDFPLSSLQELCAYHQPQALFLGADFCQDIGGCYQHPEVRAQLWAWLKEQATLLRGAAHGGLWPEVQAQLLSLSERRILHGVNQASLSEQRLLPLTYRGSPLVAAMIFKYQLHFFSTARIGFDLRTLCDNFTLMEDEDETETVASATAATAAGSASVATSATTGGTAAPESMTLAAASAVTSVVPLAPRDGSALAVKAWLARWTKRVGGVYDLTTPQGLKNSAGKISWRALDPSKDFWALLPLLRREALAFVKTQEALFDLPLTAQLRGQDSTVNGAFASNANASAIAREQSTAQGLAYGDEAWGGVSIIGNSVPALYCLDFLLRQQGLHVRTQALMGTLEEVILTALTQFLSPAGAHGSSEDQAHATLVRSSINSLHRALVMQGRNEQRLWRQLPLLSKVVQSQWQDYAPQRWQWWQESLPLVTAVQTILRYPEQEAQIRRSVPARLQERLGSCLGLLIKLTSSWQPWQQRSWLQRCHELKLPTQAILTRSPEVAIMALVLSQQLSTERESTVQSLIGPWRERLQAPFIALRLVRLCAAWLLIAVEPSLQSQCGQLLRAFVAKAQHGEVVAALQQLVPLLQQYLERCSWQVDMGSGSGSAQHEIMPRHTGVNLSAIPDFLGSESERVLVFLLGEQVSPELVYGALTRARSELRLLYQEPSLEQSVVPVMAEATQEIAALHAQLTGIPLEQSPLLRASADDKIEAEEEPERKMMVVGLGSIS